MRLSLFAVPFASGLLCLLTGCSSVTPIRTAAEGKPVMTGMVHGGQQPVSGASIQLYAAGFAGDGTAASPLLLVPVVTDSKGSFNITLDYTCPASNPQVYLAATGGNPGLAAGTNNPALALLAALGPCSGLTPSTYISVNELTTVGSIAALYPYATNIASIASGAGDAAQMATAFAAVTQYTNAASGSVPGPGLSAGYYASSTEINTLGDILAGCVNSSGGTAGDGSVCGTLLNLARPAGAAAPANTTAALVNILKNPTLNVAALYANVAAGAPFQPTLTAAPPDWTLPILPIPAAPAFSLAAGTYLGSQSVTLTDATPGAVILYTVDGTTPTLSSPVYSGALQLSSSGTVKAFATEARRVSSAVSSATYTINPPPASVTASAGGGQTAKTGTAFSQPLQASVLDSAGRPVSGAAVLFSSLGTTASASVSSPSCTTNAAGVCSVTATANSYGGTYTLTASTGGLSAAYTLTNTAAHSYVVTVNTDTTAGVAANCSDQNAASQAANTNCSLRDALAAAAANASSSLPATVTFSAAAPTSITLTHGTLNLPSYTTLQGATSGSGSSLANLITVNGNAASTILNVNSGVTQAVLNNLTLSNGNAGGSANASLGGAVLSSGSLLINSCTFSGNQASSSGGALSNNGGVLTVVGSTFVNNQATAGYGGGIDNFYSGVLNVSNSTFTGNSSGTSGGGIYSNGTASIVSSTLSGNTSPYGGGIYNKLDISVSNSIVNGNTNEDCGGVYCASNWAYVVFSAIGSQVTDSNSITLAFRDTLGNSFSQTAAYGPYSVPAGIAGTFGSYLYYNTSGLDTTSITGQAIGNNLLVISPLNGATLNSFVITNPGHSFTAVPTVFANPLADHGNAYGLTGAQIKLSALGNNGGPTQTMVPQAGSAALCLIAPLSTGGTDQRGQPRTVTVGNQICQDAGAVQTSY